MIYATTLWLDFHAPKDNRLTTDVTDDTGVDDILLCLQFVMSVVLKIVRIIRCSNRAL